MWKLQANPTKIAHVKGNAAKPEIEYVESEKTFVPEVHVQSIMLFSMTSSWACPIGTIEDNVSS